MRHSVTTQDALHLACAEYADVDVFLTTDDRLLRRAASTHPPLQCKIKNPLQWILEQQK